MATDVIDTPSYPDRSSAPGRCAAHTLNAEQRPPLAVHVLAHTESVTELAGRHPVSRRFVYQQAAKGAPFDTSGLDAGVCAFGAGRGGVV